MYLESIGTAMLVITVFSIQFRPVTLSKSAPTEWYATGTSCSGRDTHTGRSLVAMQIHCNILEEIVQEDMAGHLRTYNRLIALP